MEIRIDEGLRAYIDPLTDDEREALERSLLAEGCRDALVLWGDLLVDGHNRHALCMKHGIPFETRQNTSFKSIEDVHLWMIENHLGRRSVSDFQRGVLALRKKEILQARTAAAPAPDDPPWDEDSGEPPPLPAAVVSQALSRQALARAARISSNTLGQIEKIQKAAAPELVRAVKDGAISINAAAAVATLPPERQAAAVAGGRKELQQAAREVRQAKAPPPREAVPDIPIENIADLPAEVARLRELLTRLTDERDQLKKKVMHLTVALAEARNASGEGMTKGLVGKG
ncbi:ParB N-terminal domain-containing protein [Achromobacter aegrifaciens]